MIVAHAKASAMRDMTDDELREKARSEERSARGAASWRA